MKKLILSAALILISLAAKLHAQSYMAKLMGKSKTEQTFNANEGLISIRDFVVLREGRLILELSDVQDYESFRNLDSLLLCLKNDIAFYHDSLAANATGHNRIDYVLNPEYSFKKIRFKKYPADGSIFMNQDGAVSRLKFEQDTVRIIIQKSKQGLGACSIAYAIQATFLLGNYYDIDKVVADKDLAGIIDTLQKASPEKQAKGNYPDPFSIVYNPFFSGSAKLALYNGPMTNEYERPPYGRKSGFFTVNAGIGAGLVMNTIAPMAEGGIQYNKYWTRDDHNIFRLSVAPYYFFSKGPEGNEMVNDNWFVNFTAGSIYSEATGKWAGRETTVGAGYLIISKGGYFRNTTFKLFTDILLTNGITLVPEVLFTDNCKQIYPGITLRVF